MAYDNNNIFARILRGELPCKKVYENDHALAFHDINPLMPVHVLVVPKGPYENFDSFAAEATPQEHAAFVQAIGETARIVGVSADGYRLVSNNGEHGNQEVPHLHVHIFGGRQIRGRMIRPEE